MWEGGGGRLWLEHHGKGRAWGRAWGPVCQCEGEMACPPPEYLPPPVAHVPMTIIPFVQRVDFLVSLWFFCLCY